MKESWRTWSKVSIRQGPDGGRDIDRYEQELHRPLSDYANKRVLDLGAGAELKFAKDLERADINAEVVSVSPAFSEADHRARALKDGREGAATYALSAEGDALPFPNDTFDRVVCLHVPEHVPDRAYLVRMVREAIRVLRSGGTADFMPLWDAPGTANEICDELFAELDTLKREGVLWELRNPVPPYHKARFREDGASVTYRQKILTLTKVVR